MFLTSVLSKSIGVEDGQMVRVPVEAGELYVTFRVSIKSHFKILYGLHVVPVSELQSTPDTDSNLLGKSKRVLVISK